MTPFVWMFIKTYEYLREFIVKTKAITSLIQMEYSAFEEATVPICTFVLRNGIEKEPGLYIKLSDFKGGMDVQKTMTLEAINNKESNYYFETSVKELQKIPSFPISYWANHLIYEIFNNNPTISDYFTVRNGITTGENERFIRYWFEIDFSNKNKWRPCNKGGSYRKWSGNREFVIDWENDGEH